jgi:type II secretory pathway component GspD/PulD (secretin)
MVLGALVFPVTFCGCTESIQQYVKLAGWTRPADQPIILSGSPDRDAAAYAESGERLTEADWQVLQKIAPRPIWERIEKARRRLDADTAGREPTAEAQESDAKQASSGRISRRERQRLVTMDKLPDGNVRILYELQHYGGATVTSSADSGTSRRYLKLGAADLKPLEALMSKQLGGKGTVVTLPSENKVVVICPPGDADHIIKLLDDIDAPARQAEITARIFEVSHDFDFQLGAQTLIKHIASDNKQALAGAFSPKAFVDSVTDPVTGQVADPGSALRLIQIFGDSGLSLDVTFQALVETGLVRVVSQPRMTVAAGQPASMLAGQELPIQSAKISNDKFISESVTYKPIGVQLYITPQIVGETDVKLHVVTVVSAVSGFAPLPRLDGELSSDTLVNPIIDSREAETYVTVSDGSTLVIGGLRMIRTVTREAKVPGLGDLALLEWLFKSHRSQKLINDLYFFVTPRIIR